MNSVYYSLTVDPTGTCQRQLVTSIASLREHNKSIPVHLCIYGDATDWLMERMGALGVSIHAVKSYEEFLKQFVPALALPLSHVPTLHKFISLTLLPLEEFNRVLYTDCDTYFLGNVDRLFEKYSSCDFYAREEPRSRRSPHGYDPACIDEAALLAIAQHEGAKFVPPYNAGVCLLDGELATTLATLSAELLKKAWRLIVGSYLDPQGPNCINGQVAGMISTVLTKADRDSALTYPSTNQWLVDAIALWLTLGTLPDVAHDTFLPEDVVQSAEFIELGASGQHATLVHYFTRHEKLFSAWSWKRQREMEKAR